VDGSGRVARGGQCLTVAVQEAGKDALEKEEAC